MYVTLKHKPNNGGKIQNLADIASEIMLQLWLVKSTDNEKGIATTAAKDMDEDKDKDQDNATAADARKGMQVLLELTELWRPQQQ
jgi:hypothetical protein